MLVKRPLEKLANTTLGKFNIFLVLNTSVEYYKTCEY
jgi:hypothetical protein